MIAFTFIDRCFQFHATSLSGMMPEFCSANCKREHDRHLSAGFRD